MTDAHLIKLHAQMRSLERLVVLADIIENTAPSMLLKGQNAQLRAWSAQLREEHRILTNQAPETRK